jgi:poly-gamma-glutamate capsule biosynthesis protein CapA/YwtB (metallophosphatase superfamily)
MSDAPLPRRRLAISGGVLALAAGLTAFVLTRGAEPDAVAAPPRAAAALPSASVPAVSVPAKAVPSAAVPAAAPRSLVIVAGGDVNFGRECGQAILVDPGYDPFRFIAPLWRDADLRFVNLESQLSEQGGETQHPRNRLIFTGPPGGGRTLAQAGIHVASTANNHAWDYGKKAMLETLDNLAVAGVKSVGTGRTLDAAYEPAVFDLHGRSVAVFAVTQIWNAGDIETHQGRHHVAWARLNRMSGALKRARDKYDVVLLSYHGGVEYVDVPPPQTRRFLETLAKTGFVDAVIGHHPHVPQGIGFTRGVPIFYSLGNFVFAGHDWAPWTKFGFLARLEVADGGALGVSACPYSLDGHLPKPLAAKDPASARARQHLIEMSAAVGDSASVGVANASGCYPIMQRTLPAVVKP